MRTTFLTVTLSFILVGCGQGGGSGKGSNPVPETPPDNNNGNGKLAETNYTDIETLSGEPISVTKFPSLLAEGTVDACKPGQSYFMDQCFDNLVIGDQMVFSLKSQANEINDIANHSGWKEAMSQVGDETYTNIQRFYCSTGLCREPTFYHGEVKFKGSRLGEFYVKTYFMFGRADGTKPVHQWFLDGQINLNGQTYKFPLTVANINEAYGVSISPYAAFYEEETSWGSIEFRIEDDGFNMGTGVLEMPANPLDKRVIGIRYVFSDTN